MSIDYDNLINSILENLTRIEHIKVDEIPDIDLYMDQVTTLMDSKLRVKTRYPQEDKVMTKTMINNYAKNDLLPPPVKKKYSREHVLLLIFIYYYKNILSISDIQTLLQPITEKYFKNGKDFGLSDIYEVVFSLEDEAVEALKADVKEKYRRTQEETFTELPEEEAEFLKQFSFICVLSYDVYIKKLLIEKMIDEMKKNNSDKNGNERRK